MTSSTPATASIPLSERFARFDEQWAPQRIATVNDYDIRIAKVEGEFVWHTHPDTDEFFLVVSGLLTIKVRPAPDTEFEVTLAPGEIYVVPRGVEHCPTAAEETSILLFEPTATPNTGDAGGALTREPIELS